MGLKKIDINDGCFHANGHKYVFTSRLSTKRYKVKNELEVEMSYGNDYSGISKQVRDAFNSINGNQIKPADCAVKLYNIQQSIAYAKEREPAILRYCALFINREDEDIKEFDKEFQDQKINDWHQEGLDIGDFFLLAANWVQDFKNDYLNSSQNTLKTMKKT